MLISLGRPKAFFHSWWSIPDNNKTELCLGSLQPSRKKVELRSAEAQLPKQPAFQLVAEEEVRGVKA